MVYVKSKDGKALMPTSNAKARKLLKQKKAKVVSLRPFVIKLTYKTKTEYTQKLHLGVDSGYSNIGFSVIDAKQEYIAGEVKLLEGMKKKLLEKSSYRKIRRSRLRYRKARWNNRVKSKKKGRLAPSVENKINTHIKIIADLYKILPITNIIVETASFDIQKIKNPEIHNEEYQQGEQLGFWNVREYVLFRDNHTCQCCKGKSKDKILNVHHIESRKTGGNAPNNLITLCETCHKGYHNGTVELPKTIKRGMSFKDAAFMGIMRWSFYNRLKEIYPNVFMTYGYITKDTRIKNNLPKDHYIDARCISGNPNAEPLGYYFYQKKVRCHNRQIHKANILKGGKKKLNQASYLVKGFRLFDTVEFEGQICFIFGRRSSGYFDIRKLNGEVISRSVSWKKLKILETRKSLLMERRALPPIT